MNPAYSVILFTTTSGTGLGLLFLLGVLGPAGVLPLERGFGVAAFGVALTALSVGLLASTFHLGQPGRALMAFREWRSSWLSREGVAAVATYPATAFFAAGWVLQVDADGPWAAAGILTALLSFLTVYCTAMIYRSLGTIHQWCNGWVVPNYLALALMGGVLWLNALVALFDLARPGLSLGAATVAAAALALKLGYWRFIDTTHHRSTAESATGLGHLGKVRQIEAPHTNENYLLKEMGFRVARKHAVKLRRIAVAAAYVGPMALSFLAAAVPGVLGDLAAISAALLASLGLVVERWLFMAEARHVVTLYYGSDSA
jgi:DMSO reductase anchor subunit